MRVEAGVPLKAHTRFAAGGPADLFAWAKTPQTLCAAFLCARDTGVPFYLLGDGSNVVASDAGFQSLVARYVADRLECRDRAIEAEAGGASKPRSTTRPAAVLKGCTR